MRQPQILACVLFVACGGGEKSGSGGITTPPPPAPLNVSASASPSTTLVAMPVKATANPTGGAVPYKFLFTSSTGVVCQTTDNTCTATAPSTPGIMTWTVVVTDALGTHAQTTATADVTAPPRIDSTYFTMPYDPTHAIFEACGKAPWNAKDHLTQQGLGLALGSGDGLLSQPKDGNQWCVFSETGGSISPKYNVSPDYTIKEVDTATVTYSNTYTGTAWNSNDGILYMQRVEESGAVTSFFVIADSLFATKTVSVKLTALGNTDKAPNAAYTLVPYHPLPARLCGTAHDTSTATITITITHTAKSAKTFAPQTKTFSRACP